MKNKNDKRGKSPANFYDRIAEMLNKAAIPQTITVEAEGVSPETFLATGITKRELSTTNEYGVRFEPHVIMGFCKPELSGRCVYLDYDCYWFPTELKSLKPYRK